MPMSDSSFLAQIEAAASEPDRALSLTLGHFRAETGTIHYIEPDGLLHLAAHAGNIPESLMPAIRTIPVGKGIAGLAAERKQPVDMCNLQTDTSGDSKPSARKTGAQGTVCVPMLKGDHVAGTLGIATSVPRQFSDAEIAELMTVGRLLAARS